MPVHQQTRFELWVLWEFYTTLKHSEVHQSRRKLPKALKARAGLLALVVQNFTPAHRMIFRISSRLSFTGTYLVIISCPSTTTIRLTWHLRCVYHLFQLDEQTQAYSEQDR